MEKRREPSYTFRPTYLWVCCRWLAAQAPCSTRELTPSEHGQHRMRSCAPRCHAAPSMVLECARDVLKWPLIRCLVCMVVLLCAGYRSIERFKDFGYQGVHTSTGRSGLHRCRPICGDQKVGTYRARRLAAAACAAAPCDCAVHCEKRFGIRIRVRRRRPFECSQSSACVGADSLFKRSPNAAALCSDRLESHACMSRAAASWLGIISVGVLPMAGSASTMLDARIDAL